VDGQSATVLCVAAFQEQRLPMSVSSRSVCVLVFLALDCALSGCATSSVPANWTSPTVAPAKVSLDQYLGMNCEGLKAEKMKITSRQSQLGPTLIPVVDEHKREQELSELSGEMKAVDEATAKNNCRTPTTTSSSITKKQAPVPKPGTLDSLR
jgi:hypothetical protein